MACGCPVLSSTEGALGEVTGNAVEPVDPLSITDIARQLGHLATDNSLRERLRTLGIAHVLRFDWNRTAAATLDIYERAAAKACAHDPVRIATGQQWG